MGNFEYKVIPAPRRGVRTKGAKGSAGKFAGAMEKTINELALNGWEYLRAESLPVDERHGITRRVTEVYQNVLIFRKPADVSPAEEPVAALLEDQSNTDEIDAVEEDGLFDDINDDFPDEEETSEEVADAEDEVEPEEDTKKGKKS